MNPQIENLLELIRRVRRRWLMAKVLKGAAYVTAGVIAIVVGSVWLADSLAYQRLAVTGLRIAALAVGLASVWFFCLRPLFKAPADNQVARLIEEKHPGIGDRLVTAIEFGTKAEAKDQSPVIIEKLVGDAAEHCSEVTLEAIVSRKSLLGRAAVALVPVLVFLMLLGSGSFRSGARKMYWPWIASAEPSLAILVKPGDVRIPRGLDQPVVAVLQNFNSDEATLYIKQLDRSEWIEQAMERTPDGQFRFLLFNLQQPLQYYVGAKSVRSSEFKIDVVDLPMVSRLTLVYNYPAYTHLAAKKVEDGGDITALKGTTVEVIAHLTGAAQAAKIVLDNGQEISMNQQADSTYSGRIQVRGDGRYRIELTPMVGDSYPGSNEYQITALIDEPPMVVIEKPGRDVKATSVQEVFAEARAEDDTGVSALELHYSVNGGEEQKIILSQAKQDFPKLTTGSYTFFLEELTLQPGDVISYYAKALDNNTATGPGAATSDIYFIEIRPFDRQYRQAQQAPRMQGQGGEQNQSALAERQKELIAATWRVEREREKSSPQEFTENVGAVEHGQTKLREDVDGLVDRIMRRMGGALDEQQDFKKLVDYLMKAGIEMNGAIEQLRGKNPKDALPFEQRAYQQLLRADAIFREIQVAFGQQQGGQGGGNQQAQDLADLFELELDKMKNQYETLQRDQGQQRQQQLDELSRKLRELAERQQKMAEQNVRRGMQQQSGGGGGSSQAQQQQLIEEARQLARQLERLSREQNNNELNEISRQLNQAAEEMQRANRSGNSSDAAARSLKALEQLEAARRKLQESSQASLQNEVKRLREQAAEASRRQQGIVDDVDRLARSATSEGNSSQAGQRRQSIQQRKDMLADQVQRLGSNIEAAARSAGRDQQAATDRLREAANNIRRQRLPEQIEQGKRFLDNEWLGYASQQERGIKRGLDEVVKNLEAAERSVGRTSGTGDLERALDQTKRLADNLESLERRLRDRGDQGNESASGDRNRQSARGGQQSSQGDQQGQRGQQQAGQQQGGQQQGGQQQGGQQQAGQQGGQTGNESRGGNRNADAGSNPIGGRATAEDSGGDASAFRGWTGLPRGAQQDDLRQLDRELRERLADAEELRRQLGRDKELADDVNDLLARLRKLDEDKLFNDLQELELLKSQIVDPLRRLEFELSRRLQEKLGKDALRWSDESSAPEGYRKQVEEYYKRLSRRSNP